MRFTGKEDHSTSLEEASIMTAAFREGNPQGPWSWYFSRQAFESILTQEGCMGIRIYGAYNAEGKMSPVIVGANSDGDDMYDGTICELPLGCPPICPRDNPLNSDMPIQH